MKKKVYLFVVLLLTAVVMAGCGTKVSSEDPLLCPDWTKIRGECQIVADVGTIGQHGTSRTEMSEAKIQAVKITLLEGKLLAYNSYGIMMTLNGEEFDFRNSIMHPGVYHVFIHPNSALDRVMLSLTNEEGQLWTGTVRYHEEFYSHP